MATVIKILQNIFFNNAQQKKQTRFLGELSL